MLTRLARDNPAELYKMLLKEAAKEQVEGVSEAGIKFLNAIRRMIDEYIEYYQEEYGENWFEVFESDWKGLYSDIVADHSKELLEYVRSII